MREQKRGRWKGEGGGREREVEGRGRWKGEGGRRERQSCTSIPNHGYRMVVLGSQFTTQPSHVPMSEPESHSLHPTCYTVAPQACIGSWLHPHCILWQIQRRILVREDSSHCRCTDHGLVCDTRKSSINWIASQCRNDRTIFPSIFC